MSALRLPCEPRVLIVTSFPFPHVGGASTILAGLVTRLEERGRLAGLISGDRVRPSAAQRLLYPPFRLALADRARAWKLRALVDRLVVAIGREPGLGDDLIVHTQDAAATCAALRAAPPGTPVVQSVHGPWSREARAAGLDPCSRLFQGIRGLEATAYAGAALLFPAGPEQAAILADDFGVPAGRIRILPNGIDVQRIRALADAPPPPGLPARYFVVPRRLTAKNGVDVAIRALAELGRDGVDLVIAGDGELRRPLQALARQLGVVDRTRFLGALRQDRLFPIMGRSAGVLIPSVPASGVVEPWGMSVLEGMAAGAPVIGSAIGGIAEMLVDGESGYLVPPGDVAALARAMRRVLDLDDAGRSALVARAAARAHRDFSQTAWFDRTCRFYEEVTGDSR